MVSRERGLQELAPYSGLTYCYSQPYAGSSDFFAITNCLDFVRRYWERGIGQGIVFGSELLTGVDYLGNPNKFIPVPRGGRYQKGDIFLLGPADLEDLHQLHAAVFTGQFTESDQPLLMHATNHPHFRDLRREGGVFASGLEELRKIRKFAHLFGVVRPIA
jgi:hypothetical protein